MNPNEVPKDTSGFRAIPLPWETSRLKPLAYGYNWNIVPSKDGRFTQSCQVVREPRLDFDSVQGEMLRQEMDYPEDPATRAEYIKSLEYRQSVPAKFVETSFSCTNWLITNGWTIPMEAEILEFMFLDRRQGPLPLERMALVADSVRIMDNAPDIPGQENMMREVRDYRYKRGSATRISKRAEYVLQAGEPWKGSDDPILLQKANEYLSHGPKMSMFEEGPRRVFVWVLGVFVLLLPAVLFMLHKTKRKETERNTNEK